MLIPHGLFRSAFDNTAPIIAAVAPENAKHRAEVFSYFDNLLRFLDSHHGSEDALLWPVLLERTPAAEVIGRVEGEHEEIHAHRMRAGELLRRGARPLLARRRSCLSTG